MLTEKTEEEPEIVVDQKCEARLLHLVNLSIRTGSFANLWKHQLILPHHKKSEKDQKDQAKNYIPVSHLVEIGKLIEYSIYDQVMDHFLSNNPMRTIMVAFLTTAQRPP